MRTDGDGLVPKRQVRCTRDFLTTDFYSKTPHAPPSHIYGSLAELVLQLQCIPSERQTDHTAAPVAHASASSAVWLTVAGDGPQCKIRLWLLSDAQGWRSRFFQGPLSLLLDALGILPVNVVQRPADPGCEKHCPIGPSRAEVKLTIGVPAGGRVSMLLCLGLVRGSCPQTGLVRPLFRGASVASA